MNAIEIKDLTKTFKDRRAVDGLNLTIRKGELFTLLGENGAGKTTLIKILSCLLKPTRGTAILLGNSILDNPTKVKQLLNLSPQETAVAPNLTSYENLELIAGIYNIPKTEIKECVEEQLQRFQLTDRRNDRAKILSGGLRRRLSIAMALISDPKILFLDEPTLGLDVRARRDMWKMISSLKGHTTVVLTTHYMEEAETLSDRIGIINQGILRAVGTLEELKKDVKKQSLEEIFLFLTEEEKIE